MSAEPVLFTNMRIPPDDNLSPDETENLWDSPFISNILIENEATTDRTKNRISENLHKLGLFPNDRTELLNAIID